MKNPSHIFTHLFPQKKRFFTQKCLNKLISLLPSSFKEHILYAYTKGNILYFVFDHPAFKMEFNYSKKDINDILKILRSHDPYCSDLCVKDLRAYYKFLPREEKKIKKICRYTEKAQGDFEIATTNKELQEIFQKIKDAIKKNGSSK
ncbi:hypothetical protein [Nitratiruptor sp. YY09-18]|uniref:hypothetical protein n=1 Tax=Nitratiruptor sp. YY09-18 TaxID=2724901 RepID=UPI0019153C56|nr:hypothetical protein [Nitratiruptor sp. YY09-18]BCD67670.1 hypothetical protein NitYY0918_C0570 [Nitratiruptor sp. YY09-18]